MLRLLNLRCSFCSSPLDETHLRSRGTWEGNEVWLYAANGTQAQAWSLEDAA